MDITNDYNQYGDPNSESMLTQDARRATGEEVRPQLTGALNRHKNSLTTHEIESANRLIEKHYNQKGKTILDEKLGDIIDKTFNFLGNFLEDYAGKYLQAETYLNAYDNNGILARIMKHITALSLFIRDGDNVIYIGILLIILSFFICFFNITRNYGNGEVRTAPQ